MSSTPPKVDKRSRIARAPSTQSSRSQLHTAFAPLFAGTGGIDSWLTDRAPAEVVARLLDVEHAPLSRSQLNQLLVLSQEAGLSEGFFDYYWLSQPRHTYDVYQVPGYDTSFRDTVAIRSLQHLKWGLYRFYIDALLYFGNVRSAYRYLRERPRDEISDFFNAKRFATDAMRRRGDTLCLKPIPKDRRYLISEMACKSFDPQTVDIEVDLKRALAGAIEKNQSKRREPFTAKELLSSKYVKKQFGNRKDEFIFSASELLDHPIADVTELEQMYGPVLQKFQKARKAALKNTDLYLSMVEELDVYVATSMRSPDDFLQMADFCDYVFSRPQLGQLNIRYFDPTLSAAEGHEDKGLIECLMVKCADALVYSAGSKESLGKDFEAAMALSLGKPVIFYCESEEKARFYRAVHPLTRLIDFESGVPVGAIVTSSADEVAELLARVFENRMEYDIEQHKSGHLRLKERLTGSVVRLQTSSALLRETFWNYYHRFPPAGATSFPGVAPEDR